MKLRITIPKIAIEAIAGALAIIVSTFVLKIFDVATAMSIVICIFLLVIVFEGYKFLMERTIRKEFDSRLEEETAKYKAIAIDNQKGDLMAYEFILLKIFMPAIIVYKGIRSDDAESHFDNYATIVTKYTRYMAHVNKTNDPSESWDILQKTLMGTKAFWDEFLRGQDWFSISKRLWGNEPLPKDVKERSFLLGEYNAIVKNLKKYYPKERDLEYYCLHE
jgi:hypothetical protein